MVKQAELIDLSIVSNAQAISHYVQECNSKLTLKSVEPNVSTMFVSETHM